MKHLLGVDPGKTTGVAHIDTEQVCVVDSNELDVQGYYEYLENFLEAYKGTCEVVIEDYIITSRTAKLSQQPYSLKLIGVTEYLCSKYDVDLTIQAPSKKAFATNEKLKKIGWHHKGGKGHALDAMRHCLVKMIDVDPTVGKLLI